MLGALTSPSPSTGCPTADTHRPVSTGISYTLERNSQCYKGDDEVYFLVEHADSEALCGARITSASYAICSSGMPKPAAAHYSIVRSSM